MQKKLLIIDISNIIYTSYHGMKLSSYTRYLDRNGKPVWISIGIIKTIKNIVDHFKSSDILIARDLKYNSLFRKMIYPDYKANRADKVAEDDLTYQFKNIEKCISSLGISSFGLSGFEADDIINSAVSLYYDMYDCIDIFTADKDICQLVDGNKVNVYLNNKKGKEFMDMEKLSTLEDVKYHYGVLPKQIPDLFGIIGDVSDNIPGIPGIKQQIASKIFDQGFVNIEHLYNNLDDLQKIDPFSERDLKKLIEIHKEQVFLARDLARLQLVDVPSGFSFDGLDIKSIMLFAEEIGQTRVINKILGLPEDMSINDYTFLETMTNTLIMCCDEYYSKGYSNLSDTQYDMNLKRLEQLEDKLGYAIAGSPTKNVGNSKLNKNSNKYKYEVPMLSLKNSYSIEDLTNFIEDIKKDFIDAEFVYDTKYDGISLSAHYENGLLISASTRGDGTIGDIVTDNAMMLMNLPKQLFESVTCEVRGEVVISRKNYDIINNEGRFKNPRNACSCIRSSKNPQDIADRKMEFVPYILIIDEKIKTKTEEYSRIHSLGFEIGLCDYIDMNISHFIAKLELHKNNTYYPSDGLVITVNQKYLRDKIGENNKFPKWAIAYKFNPDVGISEIKDIDWQIGRTGELTPVARIEPIDLSGSTISNVTLNNYGYVERHKLKVGDHIKIVKSGEVIPKFVGVYTQIEGDVVRPKACPSCGEELEHDGFHTRCNNKDCRDRVTAYLTHIVSRDILDLDHFGESLINKMYDRGVRNILDLFNEEFYEGLEHEPEFGIKSKTNIMNSINNIKEGIELYRIISALGIPLVSTNTAKKIAIYNNIEDLISGAVTLEKSDTIAYKEFVSFIEANNALIIKLSEILNITNTLSDKESNKLNSKKFCISGKLPVHSSKIENKIIKNGGIVSSGVSKNTDYLICEETGTNKYKLAKKNDVTILSYKEFLKLI